VGGGWGSGLTGVQRLQQVDADAVANAPQTIGMICKKADTGQMCNIGGGFRRTDDYQDYPCYLNSDKDMCLYHSQSSGLWMLASGGAGSGSYYDKLSSNVINPVNLSGEWDHAGNTNFCYEVTWPEDSSAVEGFEDEEFPADSSSLGDGKDADWVRGSQIVRGSEVKLFDTIDPCDLMQGSLGDCWLIAALCCAAEFPRRIENVFPNGADLSPDGQYTVRLWDLRSEEFVNVVVDDRIPCKSFEWWQKIAETHYAKPKGAEIWCLLLEKAFAKLHLSYKAMEGGNCAQG
jgi:hypothetical protein